MRQWVLSVPFALRYLFATHPAVMGQVLGIVYRAISSHLIKAAGYHHATAQTGAVTLIQRFGSALNLNVHLHMLVLDGVYMHAQDKLRFHELCAPAIADMQRLLDAIVSRVLRCLERDGLLIRDPEQLWLDLASRDALDALGAASIQYRIAIGPHAGRKALTLKLASPARPSTVPKPFTVARDGFSLNAVVAFAAHQREGIERLCRYVTGPRAGGLRSHWNVFSSNNAGQVVYQLKTPYRDGTTHFVFEPLDFLARLAALVPRPRGNLVSYHGILAPNARYRSAVTPGTATRKRRRPRRAHAHGQTLYDDHRGDDSNGNAPTAPMTWLARRVTYHCAECSRSIHASARTAADGCGSLRGAACRCDAPGCDPAQAGGRHTAHVTKQQGPPEFSAGRNSATIH